jgi:predicted ATP-binding protein involved in virulence
MYLTPKQIILSIGYLRNVHPFYGITFLACKENKLPVENIIELSLVDIIKNFMEKVHKIKPDSKYYFQPYKTAQKEKQWLNDHYPSKELQTINTQTFKTAFIHERNGKTWGWQKNYIHILEEKLNKNKLPAFDLAIWLFKYEKWPSDASSQIILDKFYSQFHITDEEKKALFNTTIKNNLSTTMFQEKMPKWEDFSAAISLPPDASPNRGATLSRIETRNIGNSSDLIMEPSSRLNLITGDNGLGKTFLLECSWWALTNTWPDLPINPTNLTGKKNASITYKLSGIKGLPVEKVVIYDIKNASWPSDRKKETTPGLIIYARVDGSYAVWDPIKQNQKEQTTMTNNIFTRDDIWNGITGNIEGLIRDWVKWQNTPEKYPFKIFEVVLERMSPPDLGVLKPGAIRRILNDNREMPTILHSYGETPIVYASAGVKRIITLAYLIVWAWNEHKVEAELRNLTPENRMVIIIDEIEAHLHPKWQRVILSALMDLQQLLSPELEIQFIISTHSPLILASAETFFDKNIDSLFNFKLDTISNQVSFEKLDFIKYGQVNMWLTSPIFNLEQARSREAEEAISRAKKLQLTTEHDKQKIDLIHKQLVELLAENDPFWPRWIYFAEQNGVSI